MSDKKVEDKLDEISQRIGSIDVTLAKQEVSLKEHIRRTEILEDKIVPIDHHIYELKGAIRFVKILGIVGALAEALRQILGH